MKTIRILLAVSVVMAVVGLTSSALAQTGSAEQPPDEVQPGGFPNVGGPDTGPNVGPNVGPSEFGGPGQLPFTGAHVVVFAAVGLLAIASGAALVRRTRATKTRA